MGKMSKRKGVAGEREAAEKLNEVLGTRAHRGRKYHVSVNGSQSDESREIVQGAQEGGS